MSKKNYKCTKGEIAYLSANTQRVFKTYEIAFNDAKCYYMYIRGMSEDIAEALSRHDIYIVHMWLDKN